MVSQLQADLASPRQGGSCFCWTNLLHFRIDVLHVNLYRRVMQQLNNQPRQGGNSGEKRERASSSAALVSPSKVAKSFYRSLLETFNSFWLSLEIRWGIDCLWRRHEKFCLVSFTSWINNDRCLLDLIFNHVLMQERDWRTARYALRPRECLRPRPSAAPQSVTLFSAQTACVRTMRAGLFHFPQCGVRFYSCKLLTFPLIQRLQTDENRVQGAKIRSCDK